MLLAEKMNENKIICAARKFLMSNAFMVFECLLACVFVVLRGRGNDHMAALVYGDVILMCIICIILFICDDLMTTTLPFLLICCISLKCYDSFDIFIKFIYLAPLPVAALLFHFIVYRQPLDFGKTWKGVLAVAVAVSLGGVGKISAAEYFSGTALFYTIGLGIGMLGIYLLMNSHFNWSRQYNMRYRFSIIMMLVGCVCVFMIAHHYVMYWGNFLHKMSPVYFQWRNNVSTILLLTIPFTFFLSSTYYGCFFVAMLQYVGILFTGSRGGVISGTISVALSLIILVYCDKRNRKKTLIIIASTVFVALTFFMRPLMKFFEPLLARIANGDDIREGLISRAIKDFNSNIIFGRGLGYNGNTDIHSTPKFAICWYHSAPFQVIGSFGLVGVVCFLYQFFNRMKVTWERITQFNLTLFIAYAGLFLMSLVNPGEFCPVPYGLMATLLFIICDKNNIAALSNKEKEEEYKIEI
ncbi:MAG: O-antigen ligase family protein [Ruminococcus sp.]|nr:O-antigen ligase family protein [Candidatus Copronaster equi]